VALDRQLRQGGGDIEDGKRAGGEGAVATVTEEG